MSRPPEDDPPHHLLEAYLRTVRVRSWSTPQLGRGGGHSDKARLVLDHGVIALAKLGDGGGILTTQAKNEAAAWVIAEILGFQELCPPTVYRQVECAPQDIGSRDAAVTVLWPDVVDDPTLDKLLIEQRRRAALFDYLILNSDRQHNWLGLVNRSTGAVDLVLIDHGHCFGLHGDQVRSIFLGAHGGDTLDGELRAALRRLIESAPVHPVLADLLPREVVLAVIARAQRALDADQIPRTL